jgi:MoaA/NifB/PqqE/SkfB family radical SAM enzyme
MIGKGLAFTGHPILAHIVPMRRCNLSCTYCNEYDDFSPPIPEKVMLERVDRLADLGLTVLVISGGEPLMHPQLDNIIARARKRGVLSGLITNGYLLNVDRIHRLNKAGLDHMQISIDNVHPDEVSKKSLKVLDKKLQMLAEHARFEVNVNSVIGGGIKNPGDAEVVSKRAVELGLMSTLGIIHDGSGQLKALTDPEQEIYKRLREAGKRSWTRFYKFQDNIAYGRAHEWSCRAGSRYLYICEDGLVHYCSQQRGYPGIPLLEYTKEHIRREFHTKKYCAPYCTVACVHVVSSFDNWRGEQTQRAFQPQPVEKPAPAAPPKPQAEPEPVASLANIPPALD